MSDTKGFNRFTQNARSVIGQGYDTAKRYGYNEYKIIHIFYALLQDQNGLVVEVFNRVGVDVESTKNQIIEEFEKYKKEHNIEPININSEIKFSNEVKDLINHSFIVASDLRHVYVGTEHLLLSLFQMNGIDFIEDLKKLGINFEVLKDTLFKVANYSMLSPGKDEFDGIELSKSSAMSSLPYFTRDMNEIAQDNGFGNITGREEEIKRMINILARKTKNNPILVGDAGVGKTAIVEGLVNKIVQKKVPASFFGKKVISLDVGSILSGARLRGDVEERITSVINDVLSEGNVIVFIDEIHTIVGAGSAGGRDSLDIANILKPYLTNSNLSVIGATTVDEYNKYFETDSALSRRFQPIFVEELNIDSAKEVVRGLVKEFEDYHHVKIKSDAVDSAVELSSKFIKDRYLPDKAIDLIDEAAAAVKVGREVAMEPELSALGSKLIEVQDKKDQALKKLDYGKASEYKKKESELIEEIENVVEGKKIISKKYSKIVSDDIIKDIIVEWTKIPIAAADISDKRLKDLSSNLKKVIIGEDRIIDEVSLAIQRSHLGLSGESRPLASFLFLGPTGVGKTELAKSLAKELFGSVNLMYQINMSEFMEPHSVAKLIGAPPGYVGYQEGGQLTTYVKRKPYSVILFDEIEKAHPDVLNLLLQILEEGEINDGKGNRASLKNCIIVMTSNIGAADISSDSKLGFNVDIDEIEKSEVDVAYEDMRDKIMEQLKLTMRPEILNRIDLIDIFRGLNKDDTYLIAKKFVNEFVIQILPKGIYLNVSDEVVGKVNDEGYSKEYGGRNIRRKVQEILENSLTQYLIDSKISKKRKNPIKLNALLKKGKVVFTQDR